jgi:S-adenosylmethionine synthetase
MPQLYPAERALPGHPDKLCDALADAIVQEAARIQSRVRADLGVLAGPSGVRVVGRLEGCPPAAVDLAGLVRATWSSAGYQGDWEPAPETLTATWDVSSAALSEEQLAQRGLADDQAIVVGYAVDQPGINYLPAESWLAGRLAQHLTRLRTEQLSLHLGPAGKVIVLLEEDTFPTRLAGCAVWLQQAARGPAAGLERAVLRALADALAELSRRVPGFDPRVPESTQVTGGPGPLPSTGVSGRQLVADAYGPRVPLGGGALSGRDFYHPQRAGALLARRLTKAVVLTGVSRTCRATLAFVPGQAEAQLVSLAGDSGLLDAARWGALLDRSLAGFGDRTTGRTDLVAVARHGHFLEPTLPWENLHFDGLLSGRESY